MPPPDDRSSDPTLALLREGHASIPNRCHLGTGAFRARLMPTPDVYAPGRGHGAHVLPPRALDPPQRHALLRTGGDRDLPQVVKNRQTDLVVVLAGCADRMDRFFTSNPGSRSRTAHHIDFRLTALGKLMEIAELMLARQNHRFSPAARGVSARYLEARMRQAHFVNARSVRNALDRARLGQAARLLDQRGQGAITAEDLMTIGLEEILASGVPMDDTNGARAEGRTA